MFGANDHVFNDYAADELDDCDDAAGGDDHDGSVHPADGGGYYDFFASLFLDNRTVDHIDRAVLGLYRSGWNPWQ